MGGLRNRLRTYVVFYRRLRYARFVHAICRQQHVSIVRVRNGLSVTSVWVLGEKSAFVWFFSLLINERGRTLPIVAIRPVDRESVDGFLALKTK